MIALVALALAADLRAAAEAAEARREWAAALDAYRACVQAAPDRDAAFCRTRVTTLAPQAADGFAGWDALEGVRRDYRTLGSDAAVARIEAALAADPEGPAVPALRMWLLNERNRRGETAEVDRLRAEMAADERTPETTLRYAEGIEANEAAAARHRVFGLVGVGIAGVYAAVAAVRAGALKWRSAALAGVALGALPAGFAAAYEDGVAEGFVYSGLVVTGAVLLAGRAPMWVAVPGTVGALAAVAWRNGWYPSLGL